MPSSVNNGKDMIRKWIKINFSPYENVLDVGPGIGTYSDMLTPEGFKEMDAVEIFKPYIETYRLADKYSMIINDNIMNIDNTLLNTYSLIIMGDILEHLSKEDAQAILERIINETDVRGIIISVPYNYEQGIHEDNIYETHLQPDLTPEVMQERYPYLKLLGIDGIIGVYYFLRQD